MWSKQFLAKLYLAAPNLLRDYWNNKWPRTTIYYPTGRGLKNVKKVFDEDKGHSKFNEKTEAYERALAEVRSAVKTKNLDDTFDYIVWWVTNHVKYKSDKYTYGKPEYWATPGQTCMRGVGECEDGAILIVALARDCGIPA